MNPPSELRERVLAAARAEPAPSRSQLRARVAIAVLVFAIVVPAVIHAGFQFAKGALPFVYVAGTLAGWIAVAAVALWIGLGRGGSMVGRPSRWLLAAAIGAPAFLLAWTFGAYSLWYLAAPESAGTCPEGVSAFGKKCLEVTFATAAVPLVALIFVRRGTDVAHPAAHGAALGAAFGALAGIPIALRCDCGAPLHLLVGHLLPVAGLAAAGALLGWWLLALRPKR